MLNMSMSSAHLDGRLREPRHRHEQLLLVIQVRPEHRQERGDRAEDQPDGNHSRTDAYERWKESVTASEDH